MRRGDKATLKITMAVWPLPRFFEHGNSVLWLSSKLHYNHYSKVTSQEESWYESLNNTSRYVFHLFLRLHWPGLRARTPKRASKRCQPPLPYPGAVQQLNRSCLSRCKDPPGEDIKVSVSIPPYFKLVLLPCSGFSPFLPANQSRGEV